MSFQSGARNSRNKRAPDASTILKGTQPWHPSLSPENCNQDFRSASTCLGMFLNAPAGHRMCNSGIPPVFPVVCLAIFNLSELHQPALFSIKARVSMGIYGLGIMLVCEHARLSVQVLTCSLLIAKS